VNELIKEDKALVIGVRRNPVSKVLNEVIGLKKGGG
jgi:hypothetical protein